MGRTQSAALPRRQLPDVAGLRLYGKDKVFRLDGLVPRRLLSIGRSRHRDIRLRNQTVSDWHANIICIAPNRFAIKDRKSTNGVYVREGFYDDFMKITDKHELKVGMYIRLGDVTLVAVDADGTCDIVARRYSDFMRNSKELYGSARRAAHYIGKRSYSTIRRWLGKESSQ